MNDKNGEDIELNSRDIYKAAQILNLGEKASQNEIKNKYKKLIKKWHPDKCDGEPEKCKEKTEQIIEAYEIIKKYCDYYLYSFEKDEIINNLPVEKRIEERWENQFKEDPLWN